MSPLKSLKLSVFRRIVAAAFLVLLFSAAGWPGHAWAQQASSTASSPSNDNASSNAPTSSRQEDQDEEVAFKHSDTVKAIGRFFHLTPNQAATVFEDFNFILLAGIILYYAVKLVPRFFRERQQKIDQQLQEARVATEQANERLSAVEQRLGRLDQEIEQLRARAEKEGAADEQRIKASIEEERKKIVAAAEHEINAISLAAERNLRKFAAELAVARASARIHLTEDDDRTLVRDFRPEADIEARRN